jgi:putative transposase-like DNA-binding protein
MPQGEIVNEKLAIDQMYARNKLRNKLVELDRATRAKYDEIVNVSNPAADRIKAINEEIEILNSAIKAKRIPQPGDKPGKHRVKVGPCPEKDRIAELRKERKEQREISRAVKLQNRQKYVAEIEQLEKGRKKIINGLYNQAVAGYEYVGEFGDNITVPALYWCNAGEIKQQHQTERSRAMKDKTVLKFHAFDGQGQSAQPVHSQRDWGTGTAQEKKERKAAFDAVQKQIDLKRQERKAAMTGKNTQEKKEIGAKYKILIENLEAQAEQIAPNIIGLTQEEIFSCTDTTIRVEALSLLQDKSNPTIWDKQVVRGDRRRAMRTVAHIRIGSDSDDKPVFISVPFVMHRPLPQNARVLSAAVNRVKLGNKFHWNVEFTVLFANHRENKSNSVVALDLGWAKDSLPFPDGRIRVAGVLQRDTSGTEKLSEIKLPPDYTQALEKYHSLHGIRDEHTNEVFALLEATATIADCSENLQELLKKSINAFRLKTSGSPPVRGLRRAVWMIRKNEAKASEQVTAILERWYERYMHLNEWIVNGRDHVLTYRNDYYRREAYRMAQESKTLLLDPDDYAEMAKIPEADKDAKPAGGTVRFMTAPSLLRNYLEEAFTNAGGMILWSTQGLKSSKTCNSCGKINENLGANRTFTCECGYVADREENAVKNVMKAFIENPALFSTKKRVSQKLAGKKQEQEQAVKSATAGAAAAD